MKRLTTVILLIFLMSVFSGCDKEAEKTRTLYLPATACYYNLSSGQMTKKVVYEYDERNFLKEIKTYLLSEGKEILEDTDSVTCDKNGNIVAFQDNVGKMESLFSSVPTYATNYTYCYNEAGQVIERKTLYAERTTTEQWNYDDQGRVSTYVTAYPVGEVHQSDYFYDDQGHLTTIRNYLNGELASMTLCEYNEAGEMGGYRTFLANGKLYEHYTYTYQENTVVKHREAVKGGISSFLSDDAICTYDEKGNLISEADGENQKPKATYTYLAVEVPEDSPRWETDPHKIGQAPIPGVYNPDAQSVSGIAETTRTIYLPEKEVRYYKTFAHHLQQFSTHEEELVYCYDANNYLTSIEEYYTNNSGLRTWKRSNTVDCDNLGRILIWGNVYYTEKITYTYQYAYNEKGLLEKKETYGGPDGDKLRHTEYWTYNASGQLSKYTKKNADDSWNQCDYSYDDQGNMVEAKEYANGELTHIVVWAYNEAGQRTETTTMFTNGGVYKQYTYRYEGKTVAVIGGSYLFFDEVEDVYTFDDAGNLISIECPGENCYKIEYTYRAVEIPESTPRYYVNPQNIGVLPQDEVRP